MRSICFFSSFFISTKVPYYIKCYLQELNRHFNEVVFIHNNDSLEESENLLLAKMNIQIMFLTNEGYDFGMWYKAFNKINPVAYDRIGLINDSCILFKKLDNVFKLIDESNCDYCGLIESFQIFYHVQSYFLILKKPAIPLVTEYFNRNGVIKDFEKIITVYELGLTKYLEQNGIKNCAIFKNELIDKNLNPAYFSITELIKCGFPLIKKKIIFGNYRKGEMLHLRNINFNFNPRYYIKLIRNSSADLLIDFKLLRSDYNYFFISFKLFWYSAETIFYNFLRNKKRMFKNNLPEKNK